MPPPSPPQPPASSSTTLDSVQSKMSPSTVFIVAILAIVFFVCGLLHLLVRHLLRLLRRRRRAAREDAAEGVVTALEGQLQHLFHQHDAGVDQAFVDALPVFLYRDVVSGDCGKGEGKDPALDCAVCLCEFAPDDRLRLLPECSHAFHLECIDAWLLSHCTCPLCRRNLLSELPPTCSPVVMVLESESSRDMVVDSATPRASDDDSGGVVGGALDPEGAEQVVEVKLGKFMCVEGNAASANAAAASAAAEAGTSSNGNASRAGLGQQRRCHSMGSYEYVMDERAPLRVAIKPPKTKPAVSESGRRSAMTECEFGASKPGSLRMAFPATTEKQQQCSDTATAKLAKDSFSVSKIWMVPSKKKEPDDAAGGVRRARSFRWPVSKREEGDDKKSGSEAFLDVEAGSCGGSSVSSLAEERPSFARRTLLWVVGGRHNRVGSCS